MKKIILAVGQIFGGGAERVVSLWSDSLVQAGYDVSILVYGRGNDEYKVSPKVKILSVAPIYKDFQKISYFKRLKMIRKIIKSNNPDCVISFLPTTQIWCHFASIGLKYNRIETVRNNPWVTFDKQKIAHRLWNSCFNKADLIIVQTPEQIDYFKKKNKKKCLVVSNPVSEELINTYKEYPIKIKNFIALGRFTEQKNYPLMINSFKEAYTKYPFIDLKIYGMDKNGYRDKLQKLIDEKNLSEVITLCDYTNNPALELSKSDAFLLTSDYEGLPNALIEAMAMGLVCISTNCKTGPKDLITNGVDGFLAETNNQNSVSESICHVIELSKEQIKIIGDNAKEKISKVCSKDNSINVLIKAIEKI